MPTATSTRFLAPLAALALLVGCGDAADVTEATGAAKSSNHAEAEAKQGAVTPPGKGGASPKSGKTPVAEPIVEAPVVPAEAFDGLALYVDPVGNASLQATLWSVSDPAGAALMEIMADQPVGLWLGDWSGDIESAVDDALDEAGSGLRVLVAYNIPNRDCGNWSAGGVADTAAYEDWIDGFALGIQGREVIVVLEPDALAVTECLDADQEIERLALLAYAVDVLGASGASVYIDAGDSNWIPSADMADQLIAANVANAAGFALNVSHTEWTANEIEYAEKLRAIVGTDAHYLIDTSRNGTGPNAAYEWCNPLGLAVGQLPTLANDVEGLDAYLWIKPPGESDGECNGGPEAGHWWPEYAADLMVAGGY